MQHDIHRGRLWIFFCPFLLVIVLSVLLRFLVSGDPFGIIKLLWAVSTL